MKFTKILAALALSLAFVCGCTMGKGIISVNDEVITQRQYDEAYNKIVQSPQFSLFGEDVKNPDSLISLMTKDRIVNELIVKTLLEQEIKNRNIVVTKEEVAAKRAEILESVGGEDRLKELLKQNNISEPDLNKDLTEEIKINKLVMAISPVGITDKEVKDFYDKNKSKFDYPDRVRAMHILIEADPNAIKQEIADSDKSGKMTTQEIEAKVKTKLEEKLAQAKEVREKAVKNVADFSKLAKEYSQDPGSKDKGGDLGFFAKGQMVKPFEEVAFKIKPNTVSEVVTTPYGYHIIVVTDRAKAGLAPFDTVKAEIKAYLEQTQKITVLQKLFDGLKAQAKIIYVDESYSPEKIQQALKEKIKIQQKDGTTRPVD